VFLVVILLLLYAVKLWLDIKHWFACVVLATIPAEG